LLKNNPMLSSLRAVLLTLACATLYPIR
jgi:hypothetical protein